MIPLGWDSKHEGALAVEPYADWPLSIPILCGYGYQTFDDGSMATRWTITRVWFSAQHLQVLQRALRTCVDFSPWHMAYLLQRLPPALLLVLPDAPFAVLVAGRATLRMGSFDG